MAVSNVHFENKVIDLCQVDAKNSDNIFSIVIGKNGSGKSSLLRWICGTTIRCKISEFGQLVWLNDMLDYKERNEKSKHDLPGKITYSNNTGHQTYEITSIIPQPVEIDWSKFPEEHHALIKKALQESLENHKDQAIRKKSPPNFDENILSHIPARVIAVSSSPFDKFPILDNRHFRLNSNQNSDLSEYYHYRGARTNNKALKGYLKSKFDQLGASFINFFLQPERKINELAPLFEYLGFDERFTVRLNFPDHFRLGDIISEKSNGPAEAIDRVRFFKDKYNRQQLTNTEQEAITASAKALSSQVFNNEPEEPFGRQNSIFDITLDLNNKFIRPELVTHLSMLANFDLIDLVDIEFTKRNSGATFLLSDASSGELCILFNVLAIAGLIKDDSLILIDEPELSLHPEWQGDFIPLLNQIFNGYKRCHFILATHSPQIISSLPEKNSFVINIETNPATITLGKKVTARSADYLLAQTFHTPGHRNEYIIAQAIDLLTAISDGPANKDDLIDRANSLIKYKLLLNSTDPAAKLLATLKKAIKVIKND